MDKNNWSLFIPIYNLEILDDIGEELRIERVTFISSHKIPLIRKRLGLPRRVSYYNNFYTKTISHKLFSEAKTYAFLKTRRATGDTLSQEFRLIKEAVYILASSQFYRERRYQKTPFGSPEYISNLIDVYMIFESNGERHRLNLFRLNPIEPYRLNKQWKEFLSYHFFPRLLKILNGQVQVSKEWRYALRRAALLAGQSHFARNIWEAFLYDMIALEVLLTKQGDRFPDAIIERVVAFFGWLTDENPKIWKTLIKRLYDLRCQFIHDGQTEDLTVRDLINADMILANLLYNLCELTNTIKSKDDIIELAKKLSARRVLGMKMKDRPKRIRFIRQALSKSEYKKLETERHWAW